MTIESITFNTAESKIVVAYEDGTSKRYTDASTYLADHPERVNDVPAMRWEIPEGWEPPAPVVTEPVIEEAPIEPEPEQNDA